MNQFNIWSYFQNDGVASFDQAVPRYRFLCDIVCKKVNIAASVLNIGVGLGYLERFLADKGYRVHALDPDSESIRKLALQGIEGQVGVAQQMPYESRIFELVIASEVLEHLKSEDLDNAIDEIWRILRPGGTFIGTVPYREVLADNLSICPHCGERFHRWGHKQTFNETRLVNLLSRKFVVSKTSRRAFVLWAPNPGRLIKSGVRWLLGRMGEQIASPHIFFICHKPA